MIDTREENCDTHLGRGGGRQDIPSSLELLTPSLNLAEQLGGEQNNYRADWQNVKPLAKTLSMATRVVVKTTG